MDNDFEIWYEAGRSLFIDFDEMPQDVTHFYELQIGLKFGIYQRYFLEKYNLLIYVKPDYDKFSIHIEHSLNKETLLNKSLINNNINSVQEILIEEAFKLTNKK